MNDGLKTENRKKIACFHCGDACKNISIALDEKIFCCEGCKTVYQVLEENGLCDYYTMNLAPGTSSDKKLNVEKYAYLDNETVVSRLIDFTDDNITNLTLYIPNIHCSSCIWLLEQLYRIDPAITQSRVNFLKREISLSFSTGKTTLRKVVEILARLGYEPVINLDSVESAKKVTSNKRTYYKMGVAFFCFGNIMLLSFPEYFGLTITDENGFRELFGILSIILSLPVLLYADTDFFRSAWNGIKHKGLNMDVPISLGIIVMYSQSLYEIISGTGPGYMDTFAGLVFFMLTGRVFQDKTYQRLSFDRDYRSYFPVAVTIITQEKETTCPVSELKPGDRIVIHNEELIPVDSVITNGKGSIDYSFVTGENNPVEKVTGDKIFAGGKQTGSPIELEVLKKVSQSRLTQLWNEHNYSEPDNKHVSTVVNTLSKYFTTVVLLIAFTAFIYHYFNGSSRMAFQVFTAVLIITCPCALSLSYPFTLGNAMRILGKKKFYLKNTVVIEQLSRITHIIFDKTGTLTRGRSKLCVYNGKDLSGAEKVYVANLTAASLHPLSKIISQQFGTVPRITLSDFRETAGQGVEAVTEGVKVKIGSPAFTGMNISNSEKNHSVVCITFDDEPKGYFEIESAYREGLKEVTGSLSQHYSTELLSGDHDAERTTFATLFNDQRYNQSPADKLDRVKELQKGGKQVLMIGDGLNDAGALKQSDTGIAISDDTNNFSPASDIIMDAQAFKLIPQLMRYSKASMGVVYFSYLISLLYNVAGLWFAVQGMLSPLVAAIIMPLSTITIITLATAGSALMGKVVFKK